ncbi:MAG: glycosyltransferase, group I [Parcubacteria group bacterium Gr01-1014_38]|nr:MAG: glycosyltransferase, group I [Parcubacteria group bacterium Gr01-1014_38]
MVSGLQSLDSCQPPDLRHLRRLTDEFGVLQHTRREHPLPEFGYAIDDVARALIVVVETGRLFPTLDEREQRSVKQLADLYLRFIAYCQLPDGRFHNGVATDRTFQDGAGSQDSYGRAVWALGITSARGGDAAMRAAASTLLTKALPHAGDLSYLRSRAFALLGLLAVLTPEDPLSVRAGVEQLLSHLLHAFDDTATETWAWFEETLWYSNGAIPYAVLSAARHAVLVQQRSSLAERARTVGLNSLHFLLRALTQDGVPCPVGNRGWYTRGGERPLYDQQGVDAAAMVVACAEAFRLTAEVRYREAAETWWGWFFGQNIQRGALYRPEDGAVYDGINPEGLNENRGAESIVAFLIAHLALADAFCPHA